MTEFIQYNPFILLSLITLLTLYSLYTFYINEKTYKERMYMLWEGEYKGYNYYNISYDEHFKRRMRFQGRNGRWKDWYLDIDKL